MHSGQRLKDIMIHMFYRYSFCYTNFLFASLFCINQLMKLTFCCEYWQNIFGVGLIHLSDTTSMAF